MLVSNQPPLFVHFWPFQNKLLLFIAVLNVFTGLHPLHSRHNSTEFHTPSPSGMAVICRGTMLVVGSIRQPGLGHCAV